MKPTDSEAFLTRLQQIGLLSADDAAEVRRLLDEESTLLVSEAVRDLKKLPRPDFLQLLCDEFGSEYVPPDLLEQWPVRAAAIELVPSPMAHELAVFPLDYDAARNRLLILTAHPFNPHVLDELRDLVEVDDIEITFCSEADLAAMLRRGYIGVEEGLDPGDEEAVFDIGAASDEEAFPGIYGSSVADFLWQDDSEFADGEGGGASSHSEGIRGSLADMGVVELLQPLGQNRKTCSLFVEQGEAHGAIYLQDGMVIHAEQGDLQGAEAVYSILGWADGQFEILLRPWSGDPSMMESVEGLLLEGMRRMDEANR